MKKNKNKIPFSNYFKLGLIIIVTVLLAVLCRNYYLSRIDYENSISIIRDVLVSEINSDEVYSYIRENENVVLYIGVIDDENCRNLENDLKSVITSRGLENRITYLNITNDKKKTSFIKEFNKFYGTKVLGYPSFILFDEGKVKEIVTVKVGDDLSIDKVIDFLDRNNISTDIYD